MSLLLDALKKAAQDKQKNTGDAATASSSDKTSPKPAEEELTLDLEATPAPAAVLSAPSVEAPALTTATELSPPAVAAVEDLPTLADDIKPPPAEIRHEAAVVVKPAKPAPAPPQPAPSRADITQPAPKPAAPVKPSSATAPTATGATQTAAKQRDALDMMINKSRQAADRQRSTMRIGIAIICLLLILLTGVYFYATSESTPPVAAVPQTEIEPVAEVTTTEPVQQAVAVTQPATVKRTQTAAPKPRRVAESTVAAPITEPLQFSKTTRADPIESLLAQAYEKFHAGDYDGANQLYMQVLQREADNRDGLLGAAAVAMQQKQFEYARQKYQQLLILDPKDSIARAGVSAIDMDVRDESHLKSMLREQPDSPHLHFALGALYASQNRWSEAQQSYFNAYSGDNSHADYAYNLAVSLDRLSQYKTASAYYQKALQLAETRRGNFVAADLQKRIDQLAALPEPAK